MLQKSDLIVVTGAGGFIGGNLVKYFYHRGFRNIRAVDKKPLKEWYQRIAAAESLQLDCSSEDACSRACDGAREVRCSYGEQGKGTGLGLATVFGIVKHSGGQTFVNSEPGTGTTFKIFLPSVEAKLQVAAMKDTHVLVSGTGTILLVEDEAGVRDSIAEYLAESGYTVLKASRGTEALAIAERYDLRIDQLLTDLVMPQMSGVELAKRIAEVRPQVKTIFMSGYSNNLLSAQRIADPNHVLLRKPFSLSSLGERVGEALGERKKALAGS
jgi:CheY-like chemotaxis protein